MANETKDKYGIMDIMQDITGQDWRYQNINRMWDKHKRQYTRLVDLNTDFNIDGWVDKNIPHYGQILNIRKYLTKEEMIEKKRKSEMEKKNNEIDYGIDDMKMDNNANKINNNEKNNENNMNNENNNENEISTNEININESNNNANENNNNNNNNVNENTINKNVINNNTNKNAKENNNNHKNVKRNKKAKKS